MREGDVRETLPPQPRESEFVCSPLVLHRKEESSMRTIYVPPPFSGQEEEGQSTTEKENEGGSEKRMEGGEGGEGEGGKKIDTSLFDAEEGVVCAICLDGMSDESTSRLPCGHTFHTDCVDAWFDIQTQCPICRMDVDGEEADGIHGGRTGGQPDDRQDPVERGRRGERRWGRRRRWSARQMMEEGRRRERRLRMWEIIVWAFHLLLCGPSSVVYILFHQPQLLAWLAASLFMPPLFSIAVGSYFFCLFLVTGGIRLPDQILVVVLFSVNLLFLLLLTWLVPSSRRGVIAVLERIRTSRSRPETGDTSETGSG